MSQSPLSDAAKKMLAKANPAVISTVRSDGQPVSAATWYLLRGDQVLVNMDHGRKRLEHMRKDPRVSLTVLDESGLVHPRHGHRSGHRGLRRRRPRRHRRPVPAVHG